MKKILLTTTLGFLSLVTITTTYADNDRPVCIASGTIISGTMTTGTFCTFKEKFHSDRDVARSGHKNEIETEKNRIKENKAHMKDDKNDFHANLSSVKTYLIKPLTGDKKQAVNAIISTKDTAMKSLQQSVHATGATSGTIDRSGYIAQATQILTSFRTSLLPYVASGNLVAFDTFIQQKINLMISNVVLRQTNTTIKMNIGTKKAQFKERLKQKKNEYKSIIEQMRHKK